MRYNRVICHPPWREHYTVNEVAELWGLSDEAVEEVVQERNRSTEAKVPRNDFKDEAVSPENPTEHSTERPQGHGGLNRLKGFLIALCLPAAAQVPAPVITGSTLNLSFLHLRHRSHRLHSAERRSSVFWDSSGFSRAQESDGPSLGLQSRHMARLPYH